MRIQLQSKGYPVNTLNTNSKLALVSHNSFDVAPPHCHRANSPLPTDRSRDAQPSAATVFALSLFLWPEDEDPTDPHPHIGHSQPTETLEDALSTSQNQIALSSSTRTPVRWVVYVYRAITSGFTKDWCPRFPPPPAGACRACRLGCGAPTAPSSLCRLARGSLLAAPPFSPPFPSAYCPRRRAWRSCPRRRQRGRTARCAACM